MSQFSQKGASKTRNQTFFPTSFAGHLRAGCLICILSYRRWWLCHGILRVFGALGSCESNLRALPDDVIRQSIGNCMTRWTLSLFVCVCAQNVCKVQNFSPQPQSCKTFATAAAEGATASAAAAVVAATRSRKRLIYKPLKRLIN